MATKFESAKRGASAFALMVLIGGSISVTASAEDLGPPVGNKAPDIGTRLDQTGKPRTLADLMGKNGLVLMFFRSADWCPYCQAQLIDVNSGVAEIEKRGYRVAALSYDSPDVLQAFTAKRHIAYTFLSDPKSEVIDLYKLRDLQYPPGSRAYGVPRPIIFVLDKNSVIKAKLYEESFKVRPPVTAVIATLDELGKGS
jgi:peroxiredoxin